MTRSSVETGAIRVEHRKQDRIGTNRRARSQTGEPIDIIPDGPFPDKRAVPTIATGDFCVRSSLAECYRSLSTVNLPRQSASQVLNDVRRFDCIASLTTQNSSRSNTKSGSVPGKADACKISGQ